MYDEKQLKEILFSVEIIKNGLYFHEKNIFVLFNVSDSIQDDEITKNLEKSELYQFEEKKLFELLKKSEKFKYWLYSLIKFSFFFVNNE